jgi:hypothetical protein
MRESGKLNGLAGQEVRYANVQRAEDELYKHNINYNTRCVKRIILLQIIQVCSPSPQFLTIPLERWLEN